jgi:hypothetical protein
MGQYKLHLLTIPRFSRRGRVPALLLCAFLLLSLSLTTTAPARTADAADLSAWLADWDLARGMAEWRAHPGLFDSVRIFAAYFDEKDRPYLAPAWAALFGGDVRRVFGRTPVFLTVVNDWTTASGKNNRLKDPQLVRRLLADPATRAAHIDALIALARSNNFSGLEIDYENIEAAVWPQFLDFVAALFQRTRREGLTLAVLLQPQARYLGTPLPAGPHYVLMGYNLFGSHSGPGPKATPEFLAQQAQSLRAIGALDATALALATGGYDWTAPKVAAQLDETAADALLARTQAVSSRSATDGYLVSRYRDNKGVSHEVWHADAQTLATLWQAAHDAGFSRLVVWRLGGNAPALFNWLQTLKH